MALRNFFTMLLVLASSGAHAIPPSPPSAIYNKIRTIAARNCVTDNGLKISELKDTGTVKFVLELNKDSSNGTLTMIESGDVVESFVVSCK